MPLLKYASLQIGSRLTRRTLEKLEGPLRYMWAGHWIREYGLNETRIFPTRYEMFAELARSVDSKRVLYLEFGVAAGDSMRCWSQSLKNPLSSLHGFDSFEGLPSDWNSQMPKGTFSLSGIPPLIEDWRVHFFPGWFENSLPKYIPPEHDILIANVDCDLYSSASYVLKWLTLHLKSGDFLYFDEFNDPHNELRAFREFLSSTGNRYQIRGMANNYAHVLLQQR